MERKAFLNILQTSSLLDPHQNFVFLFLFFWGGVMVEEGVGKKVSLYTQIYSFQASFQLMIMSLLHGSWHVAQVLGHTPLTLTENSHAITELCSGWSQQIFMKGFFNEEIHRTHNVRRTLSSQSLSLQMTFHCVLS